MKQILLTLACFIALVSYNQTKTINISEKQIGYLRCENEMKINLSNSDTTYAIICSFQNMKYKHVTDIGLISMYSDLGGDKKLTEIISNIEECLNYMDDKSISFKTGPFVIYDFSKNLYINTKDDKYTYLSKKEVIKWLDWLKSCQM